MFKPFHSKGLAEIRKAAAGGKATGWLQSVAIEQQGMVQPAMATPKKLAKENCGVGDGNGNDRDRKAHSHGPGPEKTACDTILNCKVAKESHYER